MRKAAVTGILFLAVALLFAGATEQGGRKKSRKAPPPKVTQVSFGKDVFPVVKKYCLPCHSEEQMNPSELYLENYDAIMAGGKHGKAVIAGKADSSLIVRKLTPPPPFGDPMPLKAKILPTEAEIKILRDWINQGAKQN